ncbi:MAG: NAD(P)/FAD-dependent oxidoreductase [Nevskia sp.]|nr:NAD(P)/FAD-dependent oxidoreductase [Nevskia sp.]
MPKPSAASARKSAPRSATRSATRSGPVRVAIVGTGFSGLGMAIRLKQAGVEDFVVLEKAADVGGTWRDNHYPGCACDVQSHLYSFSFEPNPGWSRMFSPQPEIWNYLRHCADKYGIRPHIRFNAEVTTAKWDEKASVWRLKTADGGQLSAKVLVSGMGGLSRPAYPEGIKGLEKFKGRSFHSQQWDHDYDLAGKRVAVIGTGASAIQFVPQIQKEVARLDLYQRTPPWIVPKPDRSIGAFEHRLFKSLPLSQRLFRGAIYWMLEARALGFTVSPRLMKLVQVEGVRHIHRHIKAPELRARLTPKYTIGCKRVLISDDYYPALAQPNVEVIDSGIREVRAHGIVGTDGKERAVDAIIYGTGFHATDPMPRGMLFGRDGVDLVDAWKDGPEAYKGTTVAGFPNLFILMGPNTGLGHNSMVYMIESQVKYVLDALRQMDAQGLRSVDVKPEVQAGFNSTLQKQLGHTIWNTGGCNSWYLHPSGKNTTLWPGFTFRFRRLVSRFDLASYTAQDERAAPAQGRRAKLAAGAA